MPGPELKEDNVSYEDFKKSGETLGETFTNENDEVCFFVYDREVTGEYFLNIVLTNTGISQGTDINQ